MFDFIRSLIKKQFQLSHIAIISGHLHDIISCFEEEYAQDKDSKNAAIDSLKKLLDEYKDPPVIG